MTSTQPGDGGADTAALRARYIEQRKVLDAIAAELTTATLADNGTPIGSVVASDNYGGGTFLLESARAHSHTFPDDITFSVWGRQVVKGKVIKYPLCGLSLGSLSPIGKAEAA